MLRMRLKKFDEFRGIAIGTMCAEEPDADGEILDYFGSKPYIQKWSESQFQNSKGKSYGNVRFSHDEKRPVGRLIAPLEFDDAAKKVSITALIEDPVAKQMLASGTLTGFSIGGDYVSKTPLWNGLVSYVAGPSEVSVCDRPCAPSATYESVKVDGTMELRKFAPRDAVQPVANRVRVMKAAGYPTGMICAELGITAGEVQRATRGRFRLLASARKSAGVGHYKV